MENTETLCVLRDTRDLLDDPCFWTQGAAARDERESMCAETDPEACSWCLLGALTVAAHRRGMPRKPVLKRVADVIRKHHAKSILRPVHPKGTPKEYEYSSWIIRFNDYEERTWNQVHTVIVQSIGAERGAI